MPSKRPSQGQVVNYENPEWKPLLDLARIYIDDFMWMHEVEFDDGTRLQAYKHIWTRRYLHLDGNGRAFGYCEDGRYQEIANLRRVFDRVVEWSGPRYDVDQLETSLPDW